MKFFLFLRLFFFSIFRFWSYRILWNVPRPLLTIFSLENSIHQVFMMQGHHKKNLSATFASAQTRLILSIWHQIICSLMPDQIKLIFSLIPFSHNPFRCKSKMPAKWHNLSYCLLFKHSDKCYFLHYKIHNLTFLSPITKSVDQDLSTHLPCGISFYWTLPVLPSHYCFRMFQHISFDCNSSPSLLNTHCTMF